MSTRCAVGSRSPASTAVSPTIVNGTVDAYTECGGLRGADTRYFPIGASQTVYPQFTSRFLEHAVQLLQPRLIVINTSSIVQYGAFSREPEAPRPLVSRAVRFGGRTSRRCEDRPRTGTMGDALTFAVAKPTYRISAKAIFEYPCETMKSRIRSVTKIMFGFSSRMKQSVPSHRSLSTTRMFGFGNP
jgi:hypothetical protein